MNTSLLSKGSRRLAKIAMRTTKMPTSNVARLIIIQIKSCACRSARGEGKLHKVALHIRERAAVLIAAKNGIGECLLRYSEFAQLSPGPARIPLRQIDERERLLNRVEESLLVFSTPLCRSPYLGGDVAELLHEGKARPRVLYFRCHSTTVF